MQKVFSCLKQSLDVFYSFRVSTILSIFIGDTSDLQAYNVTVRNTPGIGMVAINLMGTSDEQRDLYKQWRTRDCLLCWWRTIHSVADYHNYTPTVIPKLTISASLFKINKLQQ